MTIEWGSDARAVDSMLEAVGRTPLVRLRRVAPDIELFAKVEWYGPTGSVKDRIYAHMLAKAEADGRLRAGMTIIECTTGNAGIACAAVAAIKGYACTIVMPEGMSPERRRMIEAYGARLVLTPGAGSDIDLALARDATHRRRGSRRLFLPRGVREPGQPRGAGGQRPRDLGTDRTAGSTPSSPRRGPAGGSPASRAC